MPLLLKNIPNHHFNKSIITQHFIEFLIIDEKSRRILANLFDPLGNIASYNDYYAFFKKFKNFEEFKYCKCSESLKQKLNKNEGYLIIIDFNTLAIELPSNNVEKWFLFNYSRIFNKSTESLNNYNSVPFDYTTYKSKLINNLDYFSYPLSQDEMEFQNKFMPIYDINNKGKIKFTKFFNINDIEYNITSDTSSDISDNSDDVNLYLRNKRRTEMTNPIINPTNDNEFSNETNTETYIEETNEQLEESNETNNEQLEESNETNDEQLEESNETNNEQLEESNETNDEQLEESNETNNEQLEESNETNDEQLEESNETNDEQLEESNETNDEQREDKRENSLAKELFEKHNNTNQNAQPIQQNTYSNRFWGLFGWK